MRACRATLASADPMQLSHFMRKSFLTFGASPNSGSHAVGVNMTNDKFQMTTTHTQATPCTQPLTSMQTYTCEGTRARSKRVLTSTYRWLGKACKYFDGPTNRGYCGHDAVADVAWFRHDIIFRLKRRITRHNTLWIACL